MSNWPIAFSTAAKIDKDFPNILKDLVDLKWSAVVIKKFYPIAHSQEICRRINDIEAGKTELLDADEAIARARARIRS